MKFMKNTVCWINWTKLSLKTQHPCYLTCRAEYQCVQFISPPRSPWSGLALAHLMCFLNRSAMSPFFIISRHALSQLANHYGKAGGALIQDNNTPWAFGATARLRASQQRRTVRHGPNWVVEQGQGNGGDVERSCTGEKKTKSFNGMRRTLALFKRTRTYLIFWNGKYSWILCPGSIQTSRAQLLWMHTGRFVLRPLALLPPPPRPLTLLLPPPPTATNESAVSRLCQSPITLPTWILVFDLKWKMTK